MKEQLSALVDNELSAFEERRLLTELERDTGLRATWQRYHLIRAAMLNELDDVPTAASAERLSARLAAEAASPMRRAVPKMAKVAGGFAIAATVATVAIVGLQTLNRPSLPVATPVASLPTPASPPTVRPASTRWDTTEPELERTLNVYLVQHSEFASAGMRGMLPPYARVVGYGSDTDR
jgi:sigma-E factor negative regulatory protein RseA